MTRTKSEMICSENVLGEIVCYDPKVDGKVSNILEYQSPDYETKGGVSVDFGVKINALHTQKRTALYEKPTKILRDDKKNKLRNMSILSGDWLRRNNIKLKDIPSTALVLYPQNFTFPDGTVSADEGATRKGYIRLSDLEEVPKSQVTEYVVGEMGKEKKYTKRKKTKKLAVRTTMPVEWMSKFIYSGKLYELQELDQTGEPTDQRKLYQIADDLYKNNKVGIVKDLVLSTGGNPVWGIIVPNYEEIPKKDEKGNVIYDNQGNPVMETWFSVLLQPAVKKLIPHRYLIPTEALPEKITAEELTELSW